MAFRDEKLSENVPGRYYVDVLCIDCDLCRTLAPSNFERGPEGGFSYVAKQPVSPEEEASCGKAMEECPTKAIGDDGSSS